MTHWISVSEELPPEGQLVLVWATSYEVLSYHGIDPDVSEWPIWYDENLYLFAITDKDDLPSHWQPLPAPPSSP